MKPEREWAPQRVIAPPEPATQKIEKRYILYRKFRFGTIYGGSWYFGFVKDFAIPGGTRAECAANSGQREWVDKGQNSLNHLVFIPEGF